MHIDTDSLRRGDRLVRIQHWIALDHLLAAHAKDVFFGRLPGLSAALWTYFGAWVEAASSRAR